jgi:predicted lipid-binding transport protein (Tim44 family)
MTNAKEKMSTLARIKHFFMLASFLLLRALLLILRASNGLIYPPFINSRKKSPEYGVQIRRDTALI